jgi:lactate racemase
MQIKLAYGREGLDLALPDDANIAVIENSFVPALADPQAALRAALRQPLGTQALRELVQSDDTVAIIFSDITRPTPNHLILPVILDELRHVPADQVVLCNALGTHRPNTPEELARMLGPELVAEYRIEQNNAADERTQVHLGQSSFGHDIWINQVFMDADVKILTGFIEPHFFAGFSGGGKAVMPGMAGQNTVFGNHDAEMIANPKSTWDITQGNPIFEEAREVALRTRPDFLLNVTLNRDKQITGVFAGSLETAHDAGIAFVRQSSMVPVTEPCDIVITTNSGYPLDMNLYQAVKGMSAAEQIVRPGGSIIVAAECSDGIPDHGLYGELLRAAASPEQLFDSIVQSPTTRQDQWQAQIQARIQKKADIYVFSEILTAEQIRSALLLPCDDIAATVEMLRHRYGQDARIGILPEGPQTIPYLQGEQVAADL